MLTHSADVIIRDATSQHTAREAVDWIPPLESSSKRSMPPPRPASSLPVPKKPRVAPPTISDAVVQHADREAVPPKSSDRRAPPTMLDATVQHAAREAVPPKPPPRVPWACGNTKVIAKEEPKQRFLEKLVANAAKTGRPLSAEQRLAAQARGLLPLEPRQGADLAWLSHAESAAASASRAASSTDSLPSQLYWLLFHFFCRTPPPKNGPVPFLPCVAA